VSSWTDRSTLPASTSPWTRGRLSNDVWVVTDPSSPGDAVDVLSDVLHRRWVDEPAIDYLPSEDAAIADGPGLDF